MGAEENERRAKVEAMLNAAEGDAQEAPAADATKSGGADRAPQGDQSEARAGATDDVRVHSEQQTGSAAGRTLRVKYRSKELDLPEDKVVEYASKGVDYEQKMAALKEEQQKLQLDAKEFGEYQNLKKWMQDHPNAGKAVQDMLDHVERTGKVPTIKFDEAAGEARTGDPATNQRIAALERQLFEQSAAKERSRLAGQIADAINDNPVLRWVSENSRKQFGNDLALEKLTNLVLDDPSADISMLAQAVATEFASKSETLKQRSTPDAYVKAKEKDQARFSSERPAGAIAAPVAEGRAAPKLNGADLKTGRVAAAALRFLQDSGE